MATREEAKAALQMAKAIQQDVDQILEKEREECPLSPREKEILFLAAKGLEDKAIAQSLKISSQTVKNHHNRVRTRLHVPNRTRAVVVALQHSWIEFPERQS